MENAYSSDDLLEFLDHAGSRGLMPAATATALAVASRNVFGVLTDEERRDLSGLDIDLVVKRFANKRAKDFNTSSLKEYGRRVKRAVELFLSWRGDPSNFSVKTRSTTSSRKKERGSELIGTGDPTASPGAPSQHGTYQSSIPVRPGYVLTLLNIPYDLTSAEAERISKFVKMLAIDQSST